MSEYTVTYEISVDADTPLEAAHQVEELLNDFPHNYFRPVLLVQEVNSDIVVAIDLDEHEGTAS